MIVIGITGSIATGKTFISKCFEKFGAAIFNADEQVHDLLLLDNVVYKEIKKHFPSCIKNNKIDRNLLGNEVFSNKKNIKILEDIIHPVIENKIEDFLKSSLKNGRKISILDIPLLFEKGLDKHCDYTIVTFANEDIQTKRALERDGMNADKLKSIKNLQLEDTKKLEKADFVIDTGNSKEDCLEVVKKIISSISV